MTKRELTLELLRGQKINLQISRLDAHFRARNQRPPIWLRDLALEGRIALRSLRLRAEADLARQRFERRHGMR